MRNPAPEEEFVTELTANQSALHAFVAALMPGDPGVDDVVQLTNLTLWRKRESYESGTNFRAWAFTCAKWTAMAWLKEKKRGNWLLVDEDLAHAVSERMLALTPASAGALHAALRLCLERLRPVDRDLVLSHYEEGRSLARCAELSGRSVNSLKVTLFRLRAALRRCITDRLAVEDSRLPSPTPEP